MFIQEIVEGISINQNIRKSATLLIAVISSFVTSASKDLNITANL